MFGDKDFSPPQAENFGILQYNYSGKVTKMHTINADFQSQTPSKSPKNFACGGLNFAENVKYCINSSQNLSEFQSTVLMRRGLLIVIGR